MATNSTPSELASTVPYTLDERMGIVRHRREVSMARQTARYNLAERMTCAYLRHECKEQIEKARYLAEIDAQLRRTRPSASKSDPRLLLTSLRGNS